MGPTSNENQKQKQKQKQKQLFFGISKFPLLTLLLFFILFLYFENKMKNGLQDANSKSFLENKNENRLKTRCRTPPTICSFCISASWGSSFLKIRYNDF